MANKPGLRSTQTLGMAGPAVHGGYIEDAETNSKLKGIEKYKTYSQILANVSIVAAGIRYFLNLTSSAKWIFSAAEGDTDEKFAELAEQILTEDPKTSWHRIIRKAAMFKFYGFSAMEWTAKKREDGVITFADISNRAQRTIERWEVSDTGEIEGMYQRSPQTQEEIFLPRGKCLYVVDDTLDDSPEGFGLFRHVVDPVQRVQGYERLEEVGFETDLRGIPVGKGPFTQLAKMVESGEITEADRISIEKPLREFIQSHRRGPKTGLLLDSQPYSTIDEAERPSTTSQWDMELLKASSNSLPDLHTAISRTNREIARILGVEQLLLGENSSGSHALSRDKTQAFFLLVNGTLKELAEAFKTDLLTPIWLMNGWDLKMMPKLSTESVRYIDVEEITMALRDLANSGAKLSPEDPAIDEIRSLLGLSPYVPVLPDPEGSGDPDNPKQGDGDLDRGTNNDRNRDRDDRN